MMEIMQAVKPRKIKIIFFLVNKKNQDNCFNQNRPLRTHQKKGQTSKLQLFFLSAFIYFFVASVISMYSNIYQWHQSRQSWKKNVLLAFFCFLCSRSPSICLLLSFIILPRTGMKMRRTG